MMKIKTVCDITGLTDRTVRYYIEEQLISPEYSENYLGRKSYVFSETDVQQLRDISILRKFGFSIAEIKEMFLDPDRIFHIVNALQQRKQITIDEENELLQTLLQRDAHHCYSLSELAQHLTAPMVSEPPPPEDRKLIIGQKVKCFFKSFLLGLVTWPPVALSVLAAHISIRSKTYPVFSLKSFILLLIALSPSVLMFLLPKLKLRWPRSKTGLIFLCILSIPFSSSAALGISPYSETTDISFYRELDPECFANRDCFFHELFPVWPSYTDDDAQYYYHYYQGMDYTYDIYAQWSLEKEAFYQEVDRVQALYDTTEYVTVQKGSYTCFFRYWGDPPFEKAADNYGYDIFAYDEQHLIVRYITCASLENGIDRPYYLSLDW